MKSHSLLYVFLVLTTFIFTKNAGAMSVIIYQTENSHKTGQHLNTAATHSKKQHKGQHLKYRLENKIKRKMEKKGNDKPHFILFLMSLVGMIGLIFLLGGLFFMKTFGRGFILAGSLMIGAFLFTLLIFLVIIFLRWK